MQTSLLKETKIVREEDVIIQNRFIENDDSKLLKMIKCRSLFWILINELKIVYFNQIFCLINLVLSMNEEKDAYRV